MAAPSTAADPPYDRFKELKQFDDTKRGVKGLVDSGLTTIPRFFVHPPETLSDIPKRPVTQPNTSTTNNTAAASIIPTIDLSGVDSSRRPEIVEEVARAAREVGFFQVVNHGVPVEVLERTLGGLRNFHEQPLEERARFYHREQGPVVALFSNIDLFHAKAASWRDTLQIRLNEVKSPEDLPEVCRAELVEWDQQATKVADVLMGLLCEGLGLDAGKLKEMTCLGSRALVGHYYPKCPQPDLTFGIPSHADPGVLTVLLQGHIGALQVKHDGGWIDVKPVPGALVINIGDILQIMSNGEYRSVEHRALANASQEARISIAIFFNPGAADALFGPIPELVSPEKPALYRQFTFSDYLGRFFRKELDGKSLTNFYKM